jgi:hypothetical protein
MMKKVWQWLNLKCCHKPTRADIRKAWPKAPIPKPSEPPQESIPMIDEEAIRRQQAALQIQRIIRGNFGRKLAMEKRNQAFIEANHYWQNYYRAIEEEYRQQHIKEILRHRIANQLINNVIDISILYIIELHAACLTIQK